MDWIGNAVFIPSVSLFVIGLTWGGAEYPWKSAHVLAPLIIGIVGLIVWVFVEAFVVAHPNIPFKEMNNRTTWIGFFATFMQASRLRRSVAFPEGLRHRCQVAADRPRHPRAHPACRMR